VPSVFIFYWYAMLGVMLSVAFFIVMLSIVAEAKLECLPLPFTATLIKICRQG
jgi:hypothetical protein